MHTLMRRLPVGLALGELDGLFNELTTGWPSCSSSKIVPRVVPVDVIEDKDGLKLKAEVPGLTKEDISITLEEGVLTISGEKKEESSSEELGYLVKETSQGSFSRTMSLPEGIDPESCKAVCRDGVLNVSFDRVKEEKPKSKKIKITA